MNSLRNARIVTFHEPSALLLPIQF